LTRIPITTVTTRFTTASTKGTESYAVVTIREAATFLEAVALCAAVDGGRLCTENELKNECTSWTGCGHDGDLIWVKPQMVGVDTRTGKETALAQKPF